MRRAKIVATIGPATESPERLRELISAGLNVARINMSHGERAHHVEVIRRVREAAAALNRPVAVLVDLGGPKIRTGRLAGGGPVELVEGGTIRLVTEEIEGTAEAVSISYSRLPEEVVRGDRILVDDGLIELRVEAVEPGTVVARVVNGGLLRERKGVNFPGVRLSIPSITDKDRADLAVALEAGVDYVAQSFVRSADDCSQARELISAVSEDVRLVAKIEKPEAVEDLESILAVVHGVMVARGDLGVEAPPEAVPIYQKRIIAAALAAEKFVITATQMLQSMVENPRPTRAEASDVANAIFDGTDAVMLSGETAVGEYPIEAVRTMDRIVRYAEASREPNLDAARGLMGSQKGSIERALAEAVLFGAAEAGTRTIVVITEHGSMARQMSVLRPAQRIVALTSTECAYRHLAAVWGIEPYHVDFPQSSDRLLVEVDRAVLDLGIAERGETVVIVIGVIENSPAASSVMKLFRVGDLTQGVEG